MLEIDQPPRAFDHGLEDAREVEARVHGVGHLMDQRQAFVGPAQRIGSLRDLAFELASEVLELTDLLAELHTHAIDLESERADLVGAADQHGIGVVSFANAASGHHETVDGAGDRAAEQGSEGDGQNGHGSQPDLHPPVPRRHRQKQNRRGDDLQGVDEEFAANREHGGLVTRIVGYRLQPSPNLEPGLLFLYAAEPWWSWRR